MYAYQELKSQYESLGEFRFVFASQGFARQRAPKEKREFYITQLSREQGPCGTEFEIKLRNELTQKPIAAECAAWIRDKERFKSFEGEGGMSGLLNVGKGDGDVAYCPSTSLPACV